MQSNVIEQGVCDKLSNLYAVSGIWSIQEALPFIDLRDVFCERVKFRNHKLSLEGLHDDHDARFDHPGKKENLVQVKDGTVSYFWNWLKSSLMLSIP